MRRHRQLFFLVLVVLAVLVLGDVDVEVEVEVVAEELQREQEYDPSTCRGTSLHPRSTWPLDHGDSSRSKYTLGAGFPSDVSSEKIKRIDNLDVGNSQWIYTGGENAEFIFALGPQDAVYLAKFDAKTLELLQKVEFGSCLYLGGAAVHANGHFYMIHSNRVIRFWNLDLYNSTSFDLPTSFDPYMTQTNGVLVTHDGLLVVKQWPFTVWDLNFLFHAQPKFMYLLIAIVTTVTAIRMTSIPTENKTIQGFTSHFAVSIIYGIVAVVIFLFAFLCKASHGPMDAFRFFTHNYLQGEVGELKLVDPDSLTVTASMALPERCSFARMALSTTVPGEMDSLVLLGDEFVHQLTWNSVSKELKLLPEWSKRYRTNGDGTFPGTGPAIFNGVTYFTDNTFPVSLYGHSYSMFSQPLNEFEKPLSVVHMTEKDSPPGFMFWSITVSPFVGDVLAWDIQGRSVQSRSAVDMSLHWEVKSMNADCLTMAADKNHVYFSDHDMMSGDDTNKFLPWMKQSNNVTKFLIVAHAQSGEVLVNVTISREGGISPTMIVPGAHNDVIIGTSVGISRLYV